MIIRGIQIKKDNFNSSKDIALDQTFNPKKYNLFQNIL